MLVDYWHKVKLKRKYKVLQNEIIENLLILRKIVKTQ